MVRGFSSLGLASLTQLALVDSKIAFEEQGPLYKHFQDGGREFNFSIV